MLRVVLSTSFQAFHLNVQFCAEEGTTTVLLGESGAGKSTVLRAIAGLISPDEGRIAFQDVVYFDRERRINRLAYERPFGYVFQDYALFPHLTVFENIAFGLRAQRLPTKLIRQRVGAVLEQVRLVGWEQRRPAQLSGGQQQRVAIARALVLQPKLLLLDEPLSALDVQTRREIRQELRRLLAGLGITTVMVTHHYLEALLFGDQILVLDRGRVLQQGTHQVLVQQPRSSYVAELVGTNFFRGRVVRCEDHSLYTIRLPGMQGPGGEIQAVLDRQVTTASPAIGDEAHVVIDPHSITIHQRAPEGSARNIFMGEIVQLLRIGTEAGDDGRFRVSIRFDAASQPLVAEVTAASVNQMELKERQIVYASFKATEARAYI